MSNIAAGIITIGDELLIGQVVDTNSAWMAQRLNELGIDVLRRVAIGDNKDAIINALETELASSSIILITGGLGPTADDITKPVLNEYFGGNLVIDEKVLAHLKQIFTKRNRPFLERNMKQAEVPDVCKVLFNPMGTAPGMWFEKDGKVIVSLPGVPFEMAAIMEREVLPMFKERFLSDALLHKSVITAGEGESFIAERIQDLEESLPAHIKLAYLPGAGLVKLRLTGRGADDTELEAELSSLQKRFADRLENIVIATEDIPLEKIIGRWFSSNHATLGLAESCTGGFIAHHITQVQGSSDYFKGGIVCYSNEMKEKLLGIKKVTIEEFGAISEQTVKELALGALKTLEVDFSFAVTGLMSEGGESDKVEVGTVWMAVAHKDKVETRKFWFPYDRIRNKEMTVSMGMLMILKFIKASAHGVNSPK